MAMGKDLTALNVANLLKAGTLGRHRASDNLYLQVRGKGSGSWLFRYTRDGKAHWMGIGSCRDFTLAEARGRALANRQGLTDNIDPLDAKRRQITADRIAAAKNVTFLECANAYVNAHAPSWKNDKHGAQWDATFNGSKRTAAATAAINHLPVSVIDTALAMKVLQPIWSTTTETASRVRQRCEQVIAWATVRQYREGANPFVWRGQLDTLLPKPSVLKKRKHEQNGGAHHPSIPYAELPAFMAELRGNRFVSARALEFAILTATRTNEVVKAAWSEINFAEKTWTIPAARMKAGKLGM